MNKYLLFLLTAFCFWSCNQTDNPVEPELDYDFSEIGPLLNSGVAREFVESPWDVDMNGKINLSDLVLLTTHQTPLAAPNIPPVEGPLEKGTILNNGFYEIEVKELELRKNPDYPKLKPIYVEWDIELEIKNIGDDRGISSHISMAHFRFRLNNKTMLLNHKWVGNLFLGDSIHTRLTEARANYDYGGSLISNLHLDDTITFQATTKTILFEGMAIPSGSRLGAPIVFNVVAP